MSSCFVPPFLRTCYFIRPCSFECWIDVECYDVRLHTHQWLNEVCIHWKWCDTHTQSQSITHTDRCIYICIIHIYIYYLKMMYSIHIVCRICLLNGVVVPFSQDGSCGAQACHVTRRMLVISVTGLVPTKQVDHTYDHIIYKIYYLIIYM